MSRQSKSQQNRPGSWSPSRARPATSRSSGRRTTAAPTKPASPASSAVSTSAPTTSRAAALARPAAGTRGRWPCATSAEPSLLAGRGVLPVVGQLSHHGDLDVGAVLRQLALEDADHLGPSEVPRAILQGVETELDDALRRRREGVVVGGQTPQLVRLLQGVRDGPDPVEVRPLLS